MYHYNPPSQVDAYAKMRQRIRELEEVNASTELALDVAWDEIDASRGRERRLLWTAIALGAVAAVAIMRLTMGR